MFRTKIVALFLTIISICFILQGLVFSYGARGDIKKNVILFHHGLAHQINGNIDIVLRHIVNISNLFIGNPERYTSREVMESIITSHDHKITLLAYYSRDFPERRRKLFSESGTGLVSYPELRKLPQYKKLLEAGGDPIFFPMPKEDNSFITNAEIDSIVMMRAIANEGHADEPDIFILAIPRDYIGELSGVDDFDLSQALIITDAFLNPLYLQSMDAYDAALLAYRATLNNEKYTIMNTGDKTMYVFNEKDNALGWNVFLLLDSKSLHSMGFDTSTILTIAIMTFSFICSFIIVFVITNILTKPIKSLVLSMESLGEGDWNHHVDVTGNDEIGLLGRQFNKMIDNLRELVNENYILTLKEREAELNALQSEINPHFLYNILNIIYLKSYEAGQKETANITLMLSDLFRLTLNNGSIWMDVSAEMEVLEIYLALQKFRFEDHFDYSLDIDESIMGYQIPKLILQPLVENALVHGIEKKIEKGFIEIRGFLEKDLIVFTVRDNGVGMTAEQLSKASFCRYEKGEGKRSGYALWNVRERLQLYYGNNFLFEFESLNEGGVCVKLEIPPGKSPANGWIG